MLRRLVVGAVLLGAVMMGAAACSDGAHSLDGTSWDSAAITGRELVADSALTLTFDDGRLAWNAGCNATTTDYSVDEDRLVLGAVATTTSMGCPHFDAQSAWMSSLLADQPGVDVDGDTLTLTADDVTIEFTRR